jgi:hypothetical protein
LEIRPPAAPVEAGQEFAVTVDFAGNPGILDMQFTLKFDKGRMECASAQTGALFSNVAAFINPADDTGAILVMASANPVKGDGSVGVYQFRAKERLSDFRFSIEEIAVSDGNGTALAVSVVTAGASASGGSVSSQTPNSGTGGASASGGETAATPTNAPLFTDIAGLWAEEYIKAAAERNLFQGFSDGTFRPNNRLTRAQFMKALWSMAGRPEPPKESPFEDMSAQIEDFRKAVSWAYAKGYVNGTSAATFSPGEPLTRQAAVKILFAYNGGTRGPEALLTAVYDGQYTDSGKISSWAKPAMYWAVYQNILSGNTPTTLNPGGTVTRAQIAAIMVRYADRFPA